MIVLAPSPASAYSDDTAQIQAAIDQGHDVYLSPGTYTVNKPIVLRSNLTLTGQKGGTTIQSSTSDLFTASTDVSNIILSDFAATALTGAGHIFNFNGSITVSRCEFRGLILTQQNPAKSVLTCVGTGAFFGNWLHHFEFSYVANTVPVIYIACSTVNQVHITSFVSTGDVGSTAYAIWLEQQNTSAGQCCEVNQGTFELPYGGAINFLTLVFSSIDHCAVYDAGTPAAPIFHVAKSTFAGAAPSSNCSVEHVFSNVGTSSNPDVYFEADQAGQGAFTLAWSKVNYLKGGVGGAGNAIALLNAAVNNSVNATTTTLA